MLTHLNGDLKDIDKFGFERIDYSAKACNFDMIAAIFTTANENEKNSLLESGVTKLIVKDGKCLVDSLFGVVPYYIIIKESVKLSYSFISVFIFPDLLFLTIFRPLYL